MRDAGPVNVLEALVLGVVQGFTEFLPVSSSGHLVVGQTLLGIELPGVEFEVAVHFATLVSVLVAYRRRVGALMRGSVRLDPGTWRYIALIALANVPAAAAYFLLGDVVEAAFETPAAAGVAFLATGGVLWSARAAVRRGTAREEEVSRPFSGARGLGVATLIGVAQAFALLPGISRSGATVVAALWLGVESDDAAEFSFLMSVPAIVGATLLQLLDAGETAPVLGAAPLAFGAVAAAVTGLLAIRIFLTVLRARSFHRFAPYPWILGLIFLGYLWIR